MAAEAEWPWSSRDSLHLFPPEPDMDLIVHIQEKCQDCALPRKFEYFFSRVAMSAHFINTLFFSSSKKGLETARPIPCRWKQEGLLHGKPDELGGKMQGGGTARTSIFLTAPVLFSMDDAGTRQEQGNSEFFENLKVVY